VLLAHSAELDRACIPPSYRPRGVSTRLRDSSLFCGMRAMNARWHTCRGRPWRRRMGDRMRGYVSAQAKGTTCLAAFHHKDNVLRSCCGFHSSAQPLADSFQCTPPYATVTTPSLQGSHLLLRFATPLCAAANHLASIYYALWQTTSLCTAATLVNCGARAIAGLGSNPVSQDKAEGLSRDIHSLQTHTQTKRAHHTMILCVSLYSRRSVIFCRKSVILVYIHVGRIES
jgi:hypothetical protein